MTHRNTAHICTHRNTAHICAALLLATALYLPAPAQAAPPAKNAVSLKKGFDTVVRPDGKWRTQITALRAHWFYSWGAPGPPDLPPASSSCRWTGATTATKTTAW